MLREKMRWTFFTDMLEDEYRQCIQEGRLVESLLGELERVKAIPQEAARERAARALLLALEDAPMDPAYPYREPETWTEILQALPPSGARTWPVKRSTLRDKLAGAWQGRAAGCVLGIPVEGWPRKKIQSYLEESGQFPVKAYLHTSEDPMLREKYHIHEEDPTTPYDRQLVCWRECLDGYPNDDDLNYTVLALKALERYGLPLTSENIAETWLLGIPPFHACTAERAAIRNLMEGVLPPESARRCNPYREWIGAQIRADLYGYICPGQPRRAARLACADGAVSHVKNGIYGEMFIAALISLCPVEELSMLERVRCAMEQIPPRSRLFEALEQVCGAFEQGNSFACVVDAVHARYDETRQFDWCLTIPNAMLVTACVLWHTSFEQAIGAAVLSGFDTDCNGATVGSLLGLCHGPAEIGPAWREAFAPVIHTSVHSYHEIALDDLVERTWALIQWE